MSVVDAATGTASLDDAEPEPADAVARLISLDEGFYAFTMVGEAAWGGIAPGFTVPAVHISAPPDRFAALEVTDVFGQPAEWMGARHATVLVKTPTGGGVALVTAYPARDPERPPLKLEIRRLDATGFLAAAETALPDDLPPRQPPFATVFLADPISTPASTEEVPVEIVLHVRGRGDVRFVDVPWAGRLAPGLWIESFTILPRHRFAEAAIEYKGLSATGMETDWLPGGSLCGTRGENTPLVGFAVRPKAIAGGACLDCEYSGYFQSGALVGPCRNGAPCLSETANDPLEGIQLRIFR